MNLAPELTRLFNVEEERELLERVLPRDSVEQCIQGGKTNAERIAVLCKEIVRDLMENTPTCSLLNVLSAYCLERSNAYSSMHRRLQNFPSFVRVIAECPGADARPHTQLRLLQEKVKELSEESLLLRRDRKEMESLTQLVSEMNAKIIELSAVREDVQQLRMDTPYAADITKLENVVVEVAHEMKQQGNTVTKEITEMDREMNTKLAAMINVLRATFNILKDNERAKRDSDEESIRSSSSRAQRDVFRCYKCGKPGHMARNCRTPSISRRGSIVTPPSWRD